LEPTTTSSVGGKEGVEVKFNPRLNNRGLFQVELYFSLHKVDILAFPLVTATCVSGNIHHCCMYELRAWRLKIHQTGKPAVVTLESIMLSSSVVIYRLLTFGASSRLWLQVLS